MDFDDYVTARRSTLVRAAALLGCPEAEAPHLVARVVTRSARHIWRAQDPDPEVCRALVSAVIEARERWPDPPPLPDEDAWNGRGLAVRRTLAAMDPHARDVVVLLYYCDLTTAATAEAVRASRATVRKRALAAAPALVMMSVPALPKDDDDEQTRDLLLDAAETVDVLPAGPIAPQPPARKWPWAVAALAGALVLTAVVVADQPEKMDGTLDADQVPSLFGYDAAGARALLEGLGLRVTEEPIAYCDLEGRVVGTEPKTGARFAPGQAITIHTAVPSDPSCSASYVDRAAAWDFVDFANGRGPAPRFSDRVSIVIDGSYPVSLAGSEAADPERWGGFSPLSELSKASARVAYRGGTSYATPVLSVQTLVPPPQTCGVSRPPGSGQRLALVVSIALETDGPADCPPVVDLYRSSGGIDAIVLYSAKPADARGPFLSPPPWVTGHLSGRSKARPLRNPLTSV